ncbi:galactose mutarotase [Siculibacillus lacustris]|uniref:Aldose 1-epimerase n=1 Tax=Siculibacillus lacustris TaxID=1549641 RepID=A0A4Q9VWV3_9HYPH|nr:aldose epimerase family protein [Siculibacillus lacustris]TBW40713.1 galactose mutarotase [Siculibacillus lacustris]
MSLHPFGTLDDGTDIQEIRLQNAAGARASILTIGAVLRDLQIPRADGSLQRVVLGYETLEGYKANPARVGATVGRNANRIADGRFELDGRAYELPINGAGNVHLHGGPVGFALKPWTIVEHGDSFVVLSLTSEDGDQGWPGRVAVTCRYDLLEPATLTIAMSGTTDAPTILNLTNHSYFTLNDAADCRDHVLHIPSEFYTPAAANLIPTGAVAPVAGTAFDFREPIRIGDRGPDCDVNFVIAGPIGAMVPAGRLASPDRRLAVDVVTNQAGLLIYTAGGFKATAPGIDGQVHGPHTGVCLETQAFVDAPNKRHFPPTVLRPGQTYDHRVEYRFSRS